MYIYNYCPICGEKLDENMIEGRLRKFCPDCNFVDYKNPKPAAGAIAVKDNQVLLIKRGVEPGKGLWAPPSGFIDYGESPEEACLRELEEETGMTGEISHLLGVYAQDAKVYGPVLVVMFLVNNLQGELKAADDAREARFVPIDEVGNLGFEIFTDALKRARDLL